MVIAQFLRDHYQFVLVVVAQLADTLTFLPAVTRVGIGAERNALVRHLYVTMGPLGPLLLKGVSVVIVLAAMWWIRERHPKRTLPVAFLVIGAGLLGAWSNVAFGLI